MTVLDDFFFGPPEPERDPEPRRRVPIVILRTDGTREDHDLLPPRGNTVLLMVARLIGAIHHPLLQIGLGDHFVMLADDAWATERGRRIRAQKPVNQEATARYRAHHATDPTPIVGDAAIVRRKDVPDGD